MGESRGGDTPSDGGLGDILQIHSCPLSLGKGDKDHGAEGFGNRFAEPFCLAIADQDGTFVTAGLVPGLYLPDQIT